MFGKLVRMDCKYCFVKQPSRLILHGPTLLCQRPQYVAILALPMVVTFSLYIPANPPTL
jgi:hypothetical protein